MDVVVESWGEVGEVGGWGVLVMKKGIEMGGNGKGEK